MAKHVFRRAAKAIFVTLTVMVSLLFLLTCFLPYANPARWWPIAFTGLIVPYLLLALIFFVIFWLLAKPVMVWIPLLTMVAGWQQIPVVFAWHPGSGFSKQKPENVIRIADWNVQSLVGLSRDKEVRKLVPERIAASVMKLHPDVICMQEFNTADGSDNIALFSRQYPYHFFSRDYRRSGGTYQSGCIIFSRYPVIDSGKTVYPFGESLIYMDIVKGDDTLRVYTTHLQSFKFKKEDYEEIEKIRGQDEESLMASRSLFRKMKLAFSRHGIQADMVRDVADKSPYRLVICGDFNDVPNSYTYFHIKGGRQDAFLKKGFGIGRTFISLSSTLRIDYILPDQSFAVKQFDMVDEDLSDHILLVTDLVLKK